MYSISIKGSSYILPSVSTFSLSDNSNVSEYPLVNRLQIIDHKYDNPREISITFTISNHNSFNKYPTVFEVIKYKSLLDKSEYLTHIYNFLTKLKRDAYIIDVRTPSKKFANCIITGISWNDNGQHAEVSLSIREIYTYLIEEVKKRVDPNDNTLPNITDLVPQDFINSVILKKSLEVDQVIISALRSELLVDDSFILGIHKIKGEWAEALVLSLVVFGATVGLAVSLLVIAKLAIVGVMIVSTGVPGIGWVVGAVVAVAVAIAGAIYGLVKWFQKIARRRKYFNEFVEYSNLSDMEKEVKRYYGVINSIYRGIERFNNVVKCYSLSSNINQSLNLTLNGENYQLEFNSETNEKDSWTLTLKDYSDKVIINNNKEMKKLRVDPLLSFFEATNINPIFQQGAEKLYIVQNPLFVSDLVLTDGNKRVIKGKKKKVNIDRLYVVTTALDLDNFKETIKKIALKAMLRKQE